MQAVKNTNRRIIFQNSAVKINSQFEAVIHPKKHRISFNMLELTILTFTARAGICIAEGEQQEEAEQEEE